jgi:enoyl-CoA hydratase/carnithine racemase
MSDLLVDARDGVVRLTLNRPQRRNALSLGLLNELQQTIERLAADATARVVILGAQGQSSAAVTIWAKWSGAANRSIASCLRCVRG